MRLLNFKTLVFGVTLAFLVGCQSAPYKTRYTFVADAHVSVQQARIMKPYSIIVTDVKSFGEGLNVDMVYTREANILEVYTKSAWVEPPTELIKTSIANGLIASNGFKDVLLSPTAIISPYKVEATIQKMLQTFENGQSFVELNLMVRLASTTSQNLVYSKIYSAKERTNTLDASGGVDAYNRALKRLLPDIIRDINRR